MKKLLVAAAACAAAFAAVPAVAQDSSYSPGTVWQFSNIKVLPGQFENYMDYLAGNWRKQQETLKAAGYVVSYHILAVNSARKDEPDLILAVEYKDYTPTAEQEAMQKKIMAAMATDPHKSEAAAGGREPMRTQIGGMELQELKFKK